MRLDGDGGHNSMEATVRSMDLMHLDSSCKALVLKTCILHYSPDAMTSFFLLSFKLKWMQLEPSTVF